MTTTYKTYKWFNPRPSTITEGQAMYRDLATKHHPDHGGSVSDMQEINAEWDELKPTLPRFCSEQAKQGRQQYQQNKAAQDAAKAAQDAETAAMADKLSKCPGLQFDVVGSWIWADTNHKWLHTLEKLGFRWSANRCKYYWHPTGDTSRRNRKASYQEIYNKYSGQSYQTRDAASIPA